MSDDKLTVVAGATGRLGRLVVQELLKRGYKVRALLVPPFDSPETCGLEGVDFAEADLQSVQSLEKALKGAKYLISTIGSKKPFSRAENDRIDNMGNRNLARASKIQSVRHMVIVSSIGTGNSRDAISCLFKLMMTPVLRAKEKSEDFIRTLGLDYTIIRPGGYTDNEIPEEVVFGEGGKITGKVKREQIARVSVDALDNPAMKNRTFEVVARAAIKEGREQFIIKP